MRIITNANLLLVSKAVAFLLRQGKGSAFVVSSRRQISDDPKSYVSNSSWMARWGTYL